MSHSSSLSRRNLIKFSTLFAAGAAVAPNAQAKQPTVEVDSKWKVKNGRIRQSVMGWCFKPMTAVELGKACRDIGIEAIEGINAKDYPAVRDLGLKISLVSGGHGFKTGPFNKKNHAMVVEKLKEGIDLAAEIGTKSVITFTGMREPGISDEEGAKNCVEAWKKVIGYAEKKKINLVLEHLNSRDDSHPMKGHPGYFGDDVDFCVKLIDQVGSENMKLLFDVYHVQIMNGDVIRRIRQYKDYIGHYHTAGNPGRAELDNTQEINYPPIMEEIVKTGYQDFVAQEFIPTWDDKVAALRHAAQVCDV
ncbi:MAG: hydroxypyruvate isomerase family protein [Verrucomicrobiia bacterium]|jgi:hydroxypyruvate isomerase